MFWDQADAATYPQWLQAALLSAGWYRVVQEGDGGHWLIVARAS